MDARPMYPKGFHPVNVLQDASGTRWTRPRRRRDVPDPIRYYYIDFGISSAFEPSDTRRTVLGTEGQDQSVPELSEETPYNPFYTDIFILGKLFENEFLNVSSPLLSLICWLTMHRNTVTQLFCTLSLKI